MSRQLVRASRRAVIRILVFLVTLSPAFASELGDEPPLAALMGQLQVYLHKLDLSVQGNNTELAAFYQHELEEVTEEIVDDVPEYDGFAISELTSQMLVPRIESLERALASGGDLRKEMQLLISTCNACHAATDHGFIKITSATSNPFNQDFDR